METIACNKSNNFLIFIVNMKIIEETCPAVCLVIRIFTRETECHWIEKKEVFSEKVNRGLREEPETPVAVIRVSEKISR